MNTNKLVKVGDFAHVITDRFADEGVKRNHYVYVAGFKPLPIEEEDPYLQRIYVLVHKVTRSGHTLPDEGLYLMDPRDLSKLSDGRQKKFYQLLRDDFEEKEAVAEAVEELEDGAISH